MKARKLLRPLMLLACAAGWLAAESPTPEEQAINAIVRETFAPLFAAAAGAQAQQQPYDAAPLDEAMRAFLAEWPDAPHGWDLFVAYSRFALGGSPARTETELFESYRDSPNRYVRDYVENRLRFSELAEQPLELSFTAMDGREVDMAQLRGKVVLLDFWASWCQPCIEELPNVKHVFAAYHEQGFEVIGVSLDKAAAQGAFARKVEEHDLPWPQCFNGLGWHDPLASKFGVTAIPATFLFDQSGRLVRSDVRGEELEAAVAELLAP